MEIIRDTRTDIIRNLPQLDGVKITNKHKRNQIEADFGIFNDNSSNKAVIVNAFSLGMYPNVLIKPFKSNHLQIPYQQTLPVKLGSSSVVSLNNYPESIICSYSAIQLKKNSKGEQEASVWDLSMFNPISYIMFAGNDVSFNPISRSLTIDSKITFTCAPRIGSLLLGMRKVLKAKEMNLDLNADSQKELGYFLELISKK